MATLPPARIRRREWVFGTIFLLFALLLLGFNAWLRFFALPDAQRTAKMEQDALQKVKDQQAALLDEETRDLFKQYSEGILAVDSLFEARDLVFTGDMSIDTYEPVVMLDYLNFFEYLQELLGRQSMLSNLTIDEVGRLSFLISTTSYRQAAQQIEALRDGFSEENQRELLSEGEEQSEESPAPVLFTGFSVTSVARNENVGDTTGLPDFLANNEATYDFIVQAAINPLYYAWLYEQQLIAEAEREAAAAALPDADVSEQELEVGDVTPEPTEGSEVQPEAEPSADVS